jgi:hypothetical protein
LNAIGALESYKTLRNACDLFPHRHPAKNRERRQAMLRELTHGKGHLDDLMLGEMNLEPDLYQRLVDYYRKADPHEV